MKRNPEYKGKWSAPLVDNPAYKGVWAPRQIRESFIASVVDAPSILSLSKQGSCACVCVCLSLLASPPPLFPPVRKATTDRTN